MVDGVTWNISQPPHTMYLHSISDHEHITTERGGEGGEGG